MRNQIKVQVKIGTLNIDADSFTFSKCKCDSCGKNVYRINNHLFKHMLLTKVTENTYINHFYKCLRVRENNRKRTWKRKKIAMKLK